MTWRTTAAAMLAAGLAVAGLLLLPGCRRSLDLDSLDRTGCEIGIRLGHCAALPEGFALSGCQLYLDRKSQTGLTLGQGWRAAPVRSSACAPTETGVTLEVAVAPGQTPLLVCNSETADCPPVSPATEIGCTSELLATLGPGTSAASLEADEESVLGAFLTVAGAGGQSPGLELVSVRPSDGQVTRLGTARAALEGQDCHIVRWSRPLRARDPSGGSQGEGAVALLVARCPGTSRSRLFLARPGPGPASAADLEVTPLCQDLELLGAEIEEGDLTRAADGTPQALLRVRCATAPQSTSGGPCADGALLVPLDWLGPTCDLADLPPLDRPASQEVLALDLAPLPVEALPGSGDPVTHAMVATLFRQNGGLAQLQARVLAPDGTVVFGSTPFVEAEGSTAAGSRAGDYLPVVVGTLDQAAVVRTDPEEGLQIEVLARSGGMTPVEGVPAAPIHWSRFRLPVPASAEPGGRPATRAAGQPPLLPSAAMTSMATAAGSSLGTSLVVACYRGADDQAWGVEVSNQPELGRPPQPLADDTLGVCAAVGADPLGRQPQLLGSGQGTFVFSARRGLLVARSSDFGAKAARHAPALIEGLDGLDPGAVTDLQVMAVPLQSGAARDLVAPVSLVVLLGERSGRTRALEVAYQPAALDDGTVPRAVVQGTLLDLSPADHAGPVRLEADPGAVTVSFRAPGKDELRRVRVAGPAVEGAPIEDRHPLPGGTRLALSAGLQTATVLATAGALDSGGPVLEDAFLQLARGEGWTRLLPRAVAPVGAMAVLPAPAGVRSAVGLAVGLLPPTTLGSRAATPRLLQPVRDVFGAARRTPLDVPAGVTALAFAADRGEDGSAAILFVTGEAGRVYLGSLSAAAEAASPRSTLSLGDPLASSSPTSAPSSPALVRLDGGLLAPSVCGGTGAGARTERQFLLIDQAGRRVGSPVTLGAQLAGGILPAGAAPLEVCPAAPLVRSGPDLIASRVKGGQTELVRVACAERPIAGGGLVTDGGPADAVGDARPDDAVAADGVTDGMAQDGPDRPSGKIVGVPVPTSVSCELPFLVPDQDAFLYSDALPNGLQASLSCSASPGPVQVLRYTAPPGPIRYRSFIGAPAEFGQSVPVALSIRRSCADPCSELACQATGGTSVAVPGGTSVDVLVQARAEGNWMVLSLESMLAAEGTPCDHPLLHCAEGLICRGRPIPTCVPNEAPVIAELGGRFGFGSRLQAITLATSDPDNVSSARLRFLDADGRAVAPEQTVDLPPPTLADGLQQVLLDLGLPPSGACSARVAVPPGSWRSLEATVTDVGGARSAALERVLRGGPGDPCNPSYTGQVCAGATELVCAGGTCELQDDRLAACAAAIPIALAGGAGSATGSLDGLAGLPGALFDGSCQARVAAEAIFRVEVPAGAGPVDLVATAAGAAPQVPTLLHVRSRCEDPTREEACGPEPALTGATVVRNVAAGPHFIFVEENGGSPESGTFQVEVRLRPVVGAGDACAPDGQASRCADGLTCQDGSCQ